jgi:hypothetical protein
MLLMYVDDVGYYFPTETVFEFSPMEPHQVYLAHLARKELFLEKDDSSAFSNLLAPKNILPFRAITTPGQKNAILSRK